MKGEWWEERLSADSCQHSAVSYQLEAEEQSEELSAISLKQRASGCQLAAVSLKQELNAEG